MQPRILYQIRLSFKLEGETMSFTDKQKQHEFGITKLALQECKGTSLSGNEKITTKNTKIVKEKHSLVIASIY